MLQFILGRSKSGKSEYIKAQIERLAAESRGNSPSIMLIVPEQYSLEAEKELFKRIGSRNFTHVAVTSFTRLSTELFREYGGLAGERCGDCAKNVIMARALNEVSDKLEIYKRNSGYTSFASAVLDEINALKNSAVTADTLKAASETVENAALKRKLSELSLITAAYDALLNESYVDPLDDIARAAAIVGSGEYFNGKQIFIDEFKGFTAPELMLLRTMLTAAQEVKISLCLPPDALDSRLNGSVFSHVFETYGRTLRLARDNSVAVMPAVKLEKTYYRSPELAHMELNLFAPRIQRYEGENRAVRAYLCPNEYAEVEFAAVTISRLVQDEGYRYRDIAVILHDQSYISAIEAAFLKYKIPFYCDKLSDISIKPVVRFLQSLLNCAVKGMTAEHIFTMLKCGMTAFSAEQIAQFENYCYVWGIKGGGFRKEFVGNPRGFKEKTTDAELEELKQINEIRRFSVGLIDEFREKTADADGCAFCTALGGALKTAGADVATIKKIETLSEEKRAAEAEDYARSWELLTEMLNELAAAIGKDKIKPQRFCELFSLAAQSYDFGTLPQGIDTVIVADAGRMRLGERRAAIIIGANKGVLPAAGRQGGIFTERERKLLSELEISKPQLDRIKEERFVAYKALAFPSERLYITARKANISGEAVGISELFSQLEMMFGDFVTETEDIQNDYFCVNEMSAFLTLARDYGKDNVLNATIKEAFGAEYGEKLKRLDEAAVKKPFRIENISAARELFGDTMRISPTRVEDFYQCRFRYFCGYGLRALPLKTAELDPLAAGNIIHKVLSVLAASVDFDAPYDEKAARAVISDVLDEYIASVMGGAQDKTKRFLYLYKRMVNSLAELAARLYAEFSQSLFRPTDFEYEISEESEITPLRLYGDKVTVYVRGKIDRIDSYVNENGVKYVRIVDYKSGRKEFKLNDVLNGLNLQMLIYLHCIEKNGSGRYSDVVPAGILYMPAGEASSGLERGASDERVMQKRYSDYRMNGLILRDREVINAMEADAQGIFIPVSADKSGGFSAKAEKSMASLAQLGQINRYLDKLITDMANCLVKGDVAATPLSGSCDYCDYKSVCGHNDGDFEREPLEFADNAEIIKVMNGEEE